MADINSLPNEVLVQIFHYYHQTELQQGIQQVLSKVCKQWQKVSRNSSLYETVDGSLSLRSIVRLAEAGALKRTKTLKFGIIKKIDSYKTIYEAMPKLKHLDLTTVCHKFNKIRKHPVFTDLDGLCPDLCELVLSEPDARCNTTIASEIFDHILQVRGPNFVKLDFSYVDIPRLQKVFLHIAANCPNLEELFAQNVRGKSLTHKFPVVNMQNGCPKLKTLRLGFPISFSVKKKEAVGFPNLEIFTHPSRDDYNFTSTSLEALLFKSPNLKILDFRGCLCVSYEAVSSLPAVDLEQLHLSFTRIAQNKVVGKLFQKWSHSLNVINMSYVKGEHINEIFRPLHLPQGLPNLEILDVSNTTINEDTIQTVFEQCPNLRFLDLEACRSLPRGTRSIYHSRSEIKELLLKFDRNKMDCN